MSTLDKVSTSLKAVLQGLLRPLGIRLQRIPAQEPERQETWFFDVQPKKFEWLMGMGIRTVIDVGAHKGEFSEWALRQFPGANVIAVEPLTECHRELAARFRANPRLTAIHGALGDANGRASMHRSSFTQSSSLLPMAESHRQSFPFAGDGGTEEVVVHRLDDLRPSLPVREPYFIKIDVQGGENALLSGGERTIAGAAVLVIELSLEELYHGQALFDAMYRKLTGLGFRYLGNTSQLFSPIDGRPMQIDALFVKG